MKRFFSKLTLLVSVSILCIFTGCLATTNSARIVMAWDLILSEKDNDKLEKKVFPNPVDVISPTWFAFDKKGATSFASKNYVDLAHAKKIKVWAVFENQSDDKLTYQMLSDPDKRKNIINQIVQYAKIYKIDGINVDFEAMERKTGILFETMVKELYIVLKKTDIVLSVDVPLMSDYRDLSFSLATISDNCDYVVLMGYDEHYNENIKIGSVASIDWVKAGIEDALVYIDSSRIILGVPFYTRVWKETTENGVVTKSHEVMGIQQAYDIFRSIATKWEREQGSGQIYAEYREGKTIYKVWLEDDHSISLKFDCVNDYTLAGFSAWRKGSEMPSIWEMASSYFR